MRLRRDLASAVLVSTLSLALFVLLAAAVSAGTTNPLDERVRAAVHASASRDLTLAATSISALGMLRFLIPATVFITLYFVFKRAYRSAAALSALMGGALVINVLLKIAVHRVRPHPFLGVNPESFSFPSGHV